MKHQIKLSGSTSCARQKRSCCINVYLILKLIFVRAELPRDTRSLHYSGMQRE